MKRVVIIMAKVPRAGNVKTRLQPFLTPDECRSLAEAFLSDAISKTHNLCDELIVAFTPVAEKDYFEALNFANLTLAEQRGANLGDKMSHAFAFAFKKISDANVVMIGTDSPNFPGEFIKDAFASLENGSQVVLGRAADGGFYLIGLQKMVSGLFENIEWSSPLVYGQISRNLETLKLKFRQLLDWYDIDEPEDLRKLYAEFLTDRKMSFTAPRTADWLKSNAGIFSQNF